MDLPPLPASFTLQSVLSSRACVARDARTPGLWVLRLQRDSRRALGRDWRALQAVSAEGVVGECELLDWQGRCWSVRPWIEGGALQNAPHEARREALAALLQAAEALHSRGIAHGRLHPSNVIVDLQQRLRIVDCLGRSGAPAQHGSGIYASPEQLKGEAATIRSDIYVLGLHAFETLVGRHPWTGGAWIDRVRRVLYEDVRLSLEEDDALPAGIGAALRALLARDPAARPASAGEVLALLAPCLPGAADARGPSTALGVNGGLPGERVSGPSPSRVSAPSPFRVSLSNPLASASAVRVQEGLRACAAAASALPRRVKRAAAVAGGLAIIGAIAGTQLAGGSALEREIDELIARKDLHRAASLLKSAEPGVADRPTLRKLLGDLACAEGRQEQCLEHYEAALERDAALGDDERLRENTLALMNRADRRWRVAKVAAKLDDVEDALVERLGHEHYWIRWNAVRALESRGSDELIPYGAVYGLDVLHAGTCKTRRAALQKISERLAADALPFLERAQLKSAQTFFGDGCLGDELERVIAKLRSDV